MKAPKPIQCIRRPLLWNAVLWAVFVLFSLVWSGVRVWRSHSAGRILTGGTWISGREPLDLITGHSDICEVHGVKMTMGRRPVLYGLLEQRSTKDDLHMLANPHAAWGYAGGCIEHSLPVARAYLCPQCVAGAGPIPKDAIFPDGPGQSMSPVMRAPGLEALEEGMRALQVGEEVLPEPIKTGGITGEDGGLSLELPAPRKSE